MADPGPWPRMHGNDRPSWMGGIYRLPGCGGGSFSLGGPRGCRSPRIRGDRAQRGSRPKPPSSSSTTEAPPRAQRRGFADDRRGSMKRARRGTATIPSNRWNRNEVGRKQVVTRTTPKTSVPPAEHCSTIGMARAFPRSPYHIRCSIPEGGRGFTQRGRRPENTDKPIETGRFSPVLAPPTASLPDTEHPSARRRSGQTAGHQRVHADGVANHGLIRWRAGFVDRGASDEITRRWRARSWETRSGIGACSTARPSGPNARRECVALLEADTSGWRPERSRSWNRGW